MKTSAILLIVVSLLTIAPVAIRAGDAPRPSHAFLAEKLAELGVTDDQRQQIHTILRNHLSTTQPLLKQLVEERRKLRQAVRADELDDKAIRAQAARVATIETDLAVERAHIVHDIKPVLTPAQLEKVATSQADSDERFDSFLLQFAKHTAED